MKTTSWFIALLLGVFILGLSVGPVCGSDSSDTDSEDGDSEYALVIN